MKLVEKIALTTVVTGLSCIGLFAALSLAGAPGVPPLVLLGLALVFGGLFVGIWYACISSWRT